MNQNLSYKDDRKQSSPENTAPGWKSKMIFGTCCLFQNDMETARQIYEEVKVHFPDVEKLPKLNKKMKHRNLFLTIVCIPVILLYVGMFLARFAPEIYNPAKDFFIILASGHVKQAFFDHKGYWEKTPHRYEGSSELYLAGNMMHKSACRRCGRVVRHGDYAWYDAEYFCPSCPNDRHKWNSFTFPGSYGRCIDLGDEHREYRRANNPEGYRCSRCGKIKCLDGHHTWVKIDDSKYECRNCDEIKITTCLQGKHDWITWDTSYNGIQSQYCRHCSKKRDLMPPPCPDGKHEFWEVHVQHIENSKVVSEETVYECRLCGRRKENVTENLKKAASGKVRLPPCPDSEHDWITWSISRDRIQRQYCCHCGKRRELSPCPADKHDWETAYILSQQNGKLKKQSCRRCHSVRDVLLPLTPSEKISPCPADEHDWETLYTIPLQNGKLEKQSCRRCHTTREVLPPPCAGDKHEWEFFEDGKSGTVYRCRRCGSKQKEKTKIERHDYGRKKVC